METRRSSRSEGGRISRLAFRSLVALCAVSIGANVSLWQRLARPEATNPPAGGEAYVEYRPVFYAQYGKSVGSSHFVDRSALTPAHVEKLRVVLDEKGVPYRLEDGTLSLPREVWEDREQVWRLTAAAMNWYWLVGYAGYEGDRRGTWEDTYADFVKRGLERRRR